MLVNRINSMQHTLDIKDTYNASMIHELRNPLNAVLGSIGLLKYSKSLSKEDMETLNIANVSGEILITLINNALDGAKLEANKLELDCQLTDVVETLTKSVSLFTWKAKEKKVNITLKISKDMPPMVEIDEARVTQVLVNLIGNAVKFTPAQGQVKVRARFIPDEKLSNDQRPESIKVIDDIDLNPIKASSSIVQTQKFEKKASQRKTKLFKERGFESEKLDRELYGQEDQDKKECDEN